MVNDLRKILPSGIDDVPRIFCWFALPFGLILIALSPPFQAMDERHHALRVYQLSMGHLLPIQRDKSLGDTLPANMWHVAVKYERFHFDETQKVDAVEFDKLLSTPLNPSQTMYIPFTNTALYAPVMYLPHLPGVLTGRLLELPPLIIMYLGRLTGLLGYVALIALALHFLPIGRWLFCLVALMPVSLYVGSSLHSDAIIIGFSLLFFALCLRLRYKRGEPGRNYRLALCGLGVGLALCKMAYLPCLFAIFLIPHDRFKDKRDWLRFLTIFWGLSILVYLVWGVYSLTAHTLEWEGVNSKEQILFLLNNPIQYIGIVLGTLIKIHLHFLMTMVGAMGHLDVVISIPHFMSYLFVLMFAALVDEDSFPDMSMSTRGLLFLIPIINLIYVMTAIYVTSVPVGHSEVSSMNGRYIIPLLPLFFLAFSNKNIVAKNPVWHRWFFVLYIGYSMLSTVWTMYMRYYV